MCNTPLMNLALLCAQAAASKRDAGRVPSQPAASNRHVHHHRRPAEPGAVLSTHARAAKPGPRAWWRESLRLSPQSLQNPCWMPQRRAAIDGLCEWNSPAAPAACLLSMQPGLANALLSSTGSIRATRRNALQVLRRFASARLVAAPCFGDEARTRLLGFLDLMDVVAAVVDAARRQGPGTPTAGCGMTGGGGTLRHRAAAAARQLAEQPVSAVRATANDAQLVHRAQLGNTLLEVGPVVCALRLPGWGRLQAVCRQPSSSQFPMCAAQLLPCQARQRQRSWPLLHPVRQRVLAHRALRVPAPQPGAWPHTY